MTKHVSQMPHPELSQPRLPAQLPIAGPIWKSLGLAANLLHYFSWRDVKTATGMGVSQAIASLSASPRKLDHCRDPILGHLPLPKYSSFTPKATCLWGQETGNWTLRRGPNEPPLSHSRIAALTENCVSWWPIKMLPPLKVDTTQGCWG